eukprot:1154326-Prymnesium_polylepis.1
MPHVGRRRDLLQALRDARSDKRSACLPGFRPRDELHRGFAPRGLRSRGDEWEHASAELL